MTQEQQPEATPAPAGEEATLATPPRLQSLDLDVGLDDLPAGAFCDPNDPDCDPVGLASLAPTEPREPRD